MLGPMGEVFAGRYELVDPLASGGAGVIWRVWDLREKEYRAGKVLKQSDSASLLRFMRETSWRIAHPHVVTPLGWVGEDDRVMFTMPLIRGGSLSALIKQRGPLPPRWAVQVTEQLLEALAKVHDQGLVHRDVKPANILLNPASAGAEPFVLLTDFGIAAPVGDPRMTRVTEVIGTPGYMSPEATYGLDPDPKQDLYSVGVVLLEMLTGQRPPKDGRPEIPQAAAGVPLGRLIARLLADDTERFTSADEVLGQLRGIEVPTSKAAPVEVRDIVPTLPEGWSIDGPSGTGPGVTRVVSRADLAGPTQSRPGDPAIRQPRPSSSAPSQGQPRITPPGQFAGPSSFTGQPNTPPPALARPLAQAAPPTGTGRPMLPPGAFAAPSGAPTGVASRSSGPSPKPGSGQISPWVWAAMVLVICGLVAAIIYVAFT